MMNVVGRHSMSWMVLCGLAGLGAAVGVGFFGFGVAPWFLVMGAFCIVMMGSMLWMMVGMGNHGRHSVMGSNGRHGGVSSGSSEESPLEILERRFAEGAVSAEDYRARRSVLVGGEPEPAGPDRERRREE